MEWFDVDVGSESEITFEEEDMLWSCLQYWTGNGEHQQTGVSPLKLSSEPFSDGNDSGDDSDVGYASHRNSSCKKVRNEEQKKRIKEKNEALNVIRGLIIDSPLISKDAKEERFTEEYTLKLCLRLIENTKREIRDYSGGPSQIPLPLAHK